MTMDSFITGPLSPLSLYSIGGVPELLGVQSYLLPQVSANLTSAAERVSALPAAAGAGLLPGGFGAGTPLAGPATGAVSAGMGRAGLLGSLSVPQSWASAAPVIKTAAAMVTPAGPAAPAASLTADTPGTLVGGMTLSGLAGRAIVGTGADTARSVGMSGGFAAAEEVATTVNIFVIPEFDE